MYHSFVQVETVHKISIIHLVLIGISIKLRIQTTRNYKGGVYKKTKTNSTRFLLNEKIATDI